MIRIRRIFTIYKSLIFLVVSIPITLCALIFSTKTLQIIFYLFILCEGLILLIYPISKYRHKINDFFYCDRYPLSKWHYIFQCSNRKQIQNCDEFYMKLKYAMVEMLSESALEDGYYRTITHSSVTSKIKRLDKKGVLTIIKYEPVYKHNLIKLQKLLLHRKCSNCENNQDCAYLNKSKEVRSFYYIEFQIHKTNQSTKAL